MEKTEYEALTPNQRLFIAGKLKNFEYKVLAEDAEGMMDILLSVEMDLPQAKKHIQKILENPRKFGYCEGGCLLPRNQ